MSQQINLYDPVLLRRRDWLSFGNVVAASLLSLAGVVAWGGLGASQASDARSRSEALKPRVEAARDALAAVSREAVGRVPDPALERELESLRGQLAMRGEILAVLRKGMGAEAVSFAEYLRALARQSGGGLWLTGFSVRADGSGMEIRGRMLEASALPDYIRRLGGEKAFQGQSFATLRVQSAIAAASSPASAPVTAFTEFSLVPQPEAPVVAPPSEGARR